MKIDELTISIIRHLRDGRKSFKSIADKLGITENTVRSRVNCMRNEGIMEIAGLVDPEGLPGHQAIYIGIKLHTMQLIDKARELSNLRGVVSAAVVTGRFDIILQVVLSQDFGILEFYTDEVSHIEGIRSVETFVVYKGFNLKVPYLL